MTVIKVDFKNKKRTKYQEYQDKKQNIKLDQEALNKTIDFLNKIEELELEKKIDK